MLSSPFTLDTVTGNSALDYTFSDVEDYRVLVHGIGPCCNFGNNGQNSMGHSTEQAVARQFLQQENRVLVLVGENGNWANQNAEYVTFLESIMSGSDFSASASGTIQIRSILLIWHGWINFVKKILLNASRWYRL